MNYRHLKKLQQHYKNKLKDQYWVRNPHPFSVTLSDLSDTIKPRSTVDLLSRSRHITRKAIENSKSLNERLENKVLLQVKGPPPPILDNTVLVSQETARRYNKSSVKVESLGIDEETLQAYSDSDQGTRPKEQDTFTGPVFILPAEKEKEKPKISISPVEQQKNITVPTITIPRAEDILCQGVKSDGEQCRNFPIKNSEYCTMHRDQDTQIKG